MTEEERGIIRAMSPEDAANDICGFLSDIVLKRELTDFEKHSVGIKAKFWFMMGAHKQNIIFEDKLDSLRKENLPSYKVDYPRWAVPE